MTEVNSKDKKNNLWTGRQVAVATVASFSTLWAMVWLLH